MKCTLQITGGTLYQIVGEGTTPTPTPTATATATVTPTATCFQVRRQHPACSVNIIDPDCGSVINTQPVDFTVILSDPPNPSNVQPTDFMVNGTPADSYMTSTIIA